MNREIAGIADLNLISVKVNPKNSHFSCNKEFIAFDTATSETGGQAFPAPNYIYDSARIDKDAFQRMGLTQGMTLRDWFAGQALVGLLAMVQNECADVWRSNDKAAEYAYQYADAMLAARKDGDEKLESR